VQDSGYISGTAAALAGVQIDSNGDQHTVPMAVNDKQLQGWSDRLSALAQTDTTPDGRPFEIIAIQHLSTKTKNFVVRIVGRAGDGQTFSIDQVTKEPTEAYRHGAPILPMPAVKPPLSSPTASPDSSMPSGSGLATVARLRLAPEAVGDAVFVGVPVRAQACALICRHGDCDGREQK
jgi:hypothetical protein